MATRKENRIVILHPKDNVGVAVKDLKAGEKIQDPELCQDIVVVSDIPFGFKIALENIPKSNLVIKYGETIGKAKCDIGIGELVHIDNMESLRGRGDFFS